MTLIAGIDPGAGGAVALYDSNTRRLIGMHDVPFWHQTIGKKKRKRVDPIGLRELFDTLQMMSVELVVMEAVGARPSQSGMFAFGYAVGLIYMSCMYSDLMVETVPPKRWKKMLNVSGKEKAETDDIIYRADELFPHDRHLWRGPKGGKLLDRAEAAMLAKFGGDFVLPTMGPFKDDAEFRLAYRNAETGA